MHQTATRCEGAQFYLNGFPLGIRAASFGSSEGGVTLLERGRGYNRVYTKKCNHRLQAK